MGTLNAWHFSFEGCIYGRYSSFLFCVIIHIWTERKRYIWHFFFQDTPCYVLRLADKSWAEVLIFRGKILFLLINCNKYFHKVLNISIKYQYFSQNNKYSQIEKINYFDKFIAYSFSLSIFSFLYKLIKCLCICFIVIIKMLLWKLNLNAVFKLCYRCLKPAFF